MNLPGKRVADDIGRALLDAADRLLADLCTHEARGGQLERRWEHSLWVAIEDSGIPLVMVDPAFGGAGFSGHDALEIMRIAGRHGTAAPVAEALLGNALLSMAGIPPTGGIVSLAPATPNDSITLQRTVAGWRVLGVSSSVPWGRYAESVVALARDGVSEYLVRIDRGGWQVTPGQNLAGQPRDRLHFDASIVAGQVAERQPGLPSPFLAGATARTIEAAGAMERLLAVTCDYVQRRVQFGRPLAANQVVQHATARLGCEVAAAGVAADITGTALLHGGAELAIAAGKVRGADAVSVAIDIAHQLHGAMGFADDGPIAPITRALWSWRDEFGSASYWAQFLGRAAVNAPAGGMWPFVADIT